MKAAIPKKRVPYNSFTYMDWKKGTRVVKEQTIVNLSIGDQRTALEWLRQTPPDFTLEDFLNLSEPNKRLHQEGLSLADYKKYLELLGAKQANPEPKLEGYQSLPERQTITDAKGSILKDLMLAKARHQLVNDGIWPLPPVVVLQVALHKLQQYVLGYHFGDVEFTVARRDLQYDLENLLKYLEQPK